MDTGVVPVASQARAQRRAARKVLDDIDELLKTVEGGGGCQEENDGATRQPAVTAFGRRSRESKQRSKHDRPTPGPGAYAVQDAVVGLRPRAPTAAFRRSPCSCRSVPCACSSKANESLETPLAIVETAGKEISGPTALYRPRATPNFRTREQKQRVRELLASRRRGPRIGYYDVSHKLVEQRTDVGHVAFASVDSNSSDKLSRAKLRKTLRAWQPQSPQKQQQLEKEKVVRSSSLPKAKAEKPRRSIQWLRAKTSQLLEASEPSKVSYIPPKESHRDLPAHEMKRQSGRDKVIAISKYRKTVVRFNASVQKDSKRDFNETLHDELGVKGKHSRFEPFAVTSGREGATFDGVTGLYMLGDTIQYDKVLQLEVNDAITRPRTQACVLSSCQSGDSNTVDTRFSPAYSPKYSMVDPSICGHRFVTFQSQLPRGNNDTIYEDREVVIQLSDVSTKLEDLRFPRSCTSVAYNKMRGRE